MSTQHHETNEKVDREELLINEAAPPESPPPSYDEVLVSQSESDANDVESNNVRSTAVVVGRIVVYKRPGTCWRICSLLITLFIAILIIILRATARSGYRDYSYPKIDFQIQNFSDLKRDLSNLQNFNDIDKSLTSELLRATICIQLPPLTYIEPWKGPEGTSVLRVNSSVIPLYTNGEARSKDLQCCYIPNLFRLSDLRIIFHSPCVPFKEKAFLGSTDIILVKCKNTGSSSSSKIVYKNIHPVITNKIEDKSHLMERVSGKTDEQMNVLIFEYDVTADSSIMKTLPRTVEIMRKEGFIEFENFRKINVSKFSNDLALVKGQSLQSSNEDCSSETNKREDRCRLYPEEFIDAGYLIERLEYSMTLHRGLDSTLDDISSCLEPKFTHDLFFRHLSRDISRRNKYLYYSINTLFDMTALDFDDSSFDLRTSQFLIELGKSGLYNNTLVLFITYTEPQSSVYPLAGKESKTRNVNPSLYLAVPQWFQRKYPSAMKNLRANRKKLITPYDVFLTIKEITNKQSFFNMTNCGSNKCRSLLYHIEYRSCPDAGIASSVCPELQYFY